MDCVLCHSSNRAELSTEMMIHFSGLRTIDNPGILVFPRVLVCLDCGSVQFILAETELSLLAQGIPATRPLVGTKTTDPGADFDRSLRQ
jgi:hypothetical protein